MRTYYIYIQRAKLINSHMEYSEYMWMPFELFGYVIGTKELYNVFKDRRKFNLIGGLHFHNSLSYNAEHFYKQSEYYIIWENKPKYSRFVIMDDKGIIRDFMNLRISTERNRNTCWVTDIIHIRYDLWIMQVKSVRFLHRKKLEK